MQELESYLNLNGWKSDLEETIKDLKDVKVLTKRFLGLSSYGFKNGNEMTSRENKDFVFKTSALWFNDEGEFQSYVSNNYWPIGPCVIGFGNNQRKYDDSKLF